jgi:hypothetical protein
MSEEGRLQNAKSPQINDDYLKTLDPSHSFPKLSRSQFAYSLKLLFMERKKVAKRQLLDHLELNRVRNVGESPLTDQPAA